MLGQSPGAVGPPGPKGVVPGFELKILTCEAASDFQHWQCETCRIYTSFKYCGGERIRLPSTCNMRKEMRKPFADDLMS